MLAVILDRLDCVETLLGKGSPWVLPRERIDACMTRMTEDIAQAEDCSVLHHEHELLLSTSSLSPASSSFLSPASTVKTSKGDTRGSSKGWTDKTFKGDTDLPGSSKGFKDSSASPREKLGTPRKKG